MTTVSDNNIQFEGIGDIAEDVGGTTARSSSVGLGTTDTYGDRSPQANQTTNVSRANSGTTRQAKDWSGCMQIISTSSQSYTIGSGKSSVTHTMRGWGTAGGLQGATNNGYSASSIGTLWDGTTTRTNTAKPLSQLGSSFDGNKWLSCVMTDTSLDGSFNINIRVYIVFEGSGAQTNDTDWTTLFLSQDGEAQVGAVDYRSTGLGHAYNRTDANNIYSRYSRIVYEYINPIQTPTPAPTSYFAGTAPNRSGFTNFISLV